MTSHLLAVCRRAALAGAFVTALCALPAGAATLDDVINAAKLGDAAEIAQEVSRGLDPNITDANGNTLLIIAAREDQPRVVEALLKYRVKINARNPVGDTALMLAALRGNTRVVELLLQAGAAPDHSGWNPLLYASFEGHTAIVDMLLARGASPDATAPNGATALMFAAKGGHQDVVARLLKAGADTERANDRGDTAESWALQAHNTDIADMIRAARSARATTR